MITGDGNLMVFFSNRLGGTITTLAIIMLIWPVILSLLASYRRAPSIAGAAKGK
jgi:hypothetical protein